MSFLLSPLRTTSFKPLGFGVISHRYLGPVRLRWESTHSSLFLELVCTGEKIHLSPFGVFNNGCDSHTINLILATG